MAQKVTEEQVAEQDCIICIYTVPHISIGTAARFRANVYELVRNVVFATVYFLNKTTCHSLYSVYLINKLNFIYTIQTK